MGLEETIGHHANYLAQIKRYLSALATIVTAAPLLDLLGTAVSMIEFDNQGAINDDIGSLR